MKKQTPIRIALAGLGLLGAGFFLARQLNYPASERLVPAAWETLLVFSPVIIALGGVMLLMGLYRWVAGFGWFARMVPIAARKRLKKAWRIVIWMVVAFSAWPYWWLDIVTRMNGERPGNEGEGMGGFLIMLFIGLPALAVAILTEVCARQNRDKPE